MAEAVVAMGAEAAAMVAVVMVPVEAEVAEAAVAMGAEAAAMVAVVMVPVGAEVAETVGVMVTVRLEVMLVAMVRAAEEMAQAVRVRVVAIVVRVVVAMVEALMAEAVAAAEVAMVVGNSHKKVGSCSDTSNLCTHGSEPARAKRRSEGWCSRLSTHCSKGEAKAS